MQNLKQFLPMEASAALISIHPAYVEKILSGEKRLEFRRGWANAEVNMLVIYATAPVQRIVAVAQLGQVLRGTKSRLWELARVHGGGISRRKLFAYMAGKKYGVALELLRKRQIVGGIDPRSIFGDEFRPPQSFRYLSQGELSLLSERLGGTTWE